MYTFMIHFFSMGASFINNFNVNFVISVKISVLLIPAIAKVKSHEN